MPNKETTLPPLSSWLAETLRVTAFPRPGNLIPEQNWWFEIVGQLPEKKTDQPRTGMVIEEGSFQNGKLILAVHPARIDWRYEPADEMMQVPDQFGNVGEFTAALRTFVSSMREWLSLNNIPPLRRLALGVVLLQPVEDIKEGYRVLSQYLPFDIDDMTSSDFLYQINRRRDSQVEIPDLRVNRLTKWSVASLIPMQIEPGPIVRFPAQFACRLEMDINTVPEFERELEHQKLESLLEEFAELSEEIVENGDIP